MELMDQLSKIELRELLGKCWMTHDGMWFAHTMMESGMETANRLNQAAIKGMATVELKRFMKMMGASPNGLQTFARFTTFFSQVREVLIPDFMNVSVSFEKPNRVNWAFSDRGCFAFNGMKMLGVEKAYHCGVLYRIECWLETLKIPYRMTPGVSGCLMAETGECRGSFHLWPENAG